MARQKRRSKSTSSSSRTSGLDLIKRAVKVRKGSPEAKAKMAALRAMRGKGRRTKTRKRSTKKMKGGL